MKSSAHCDTIFIYRNFIPYHIFLEIYTLQTDQTMPDDLSGAVVMENCNGYADGDLSRGRYG